MTTRRAIQVVDLAYGDCGKGTVVDSLARRHPDALVVRFNGGPQAGHNVVTADGRHHTFSQFGSGSFVPGVSTFLSRFMLIEPYAMLNEAGHLADIGVADPFARLSIDARCPVITPAHQAANRLRELARGSAAHGTCGMGVGEAVQDALEHPDLVLRAGELGDWAAVRKKLLAVCDLKSDLARSLDNDGPRSKATAEVSTILDPSWVDAAIENYAEVARHARILDGDKADRLLRESAVLIFEGAQGVLLDECFGFHPHTTWSTCTFANAGTLLDDCGSTADRFRLGVLRSYFTRHGAGPFVTEDPALGGTLSEPHNTAAGWQGRFRIGRFDAVAARYAIEAAEGVDAIAVTHLDRLPAVGSRICVAYQNAAEGDRIDRLPVRRPSDLPFQAELTSILQHAKPVWSNGPNDPEAFCERLSAELQSPIALTSHGPTASDKRWRSTAIE